MQRTNIYLAAEQAAALDEVATARGISRAELIRQLLDHGLRGGVSDEQFDLAAIEASAGAFPDANPVVRRAVASGDERAAHLHRMWRQGT